MRNNIFVLLLLILASCSACYAQTSPDLETGTKPFGSYDQSTFDSVNNANGNLVVNISLFGYPQRGDAHATVTATYNNKGWLVTESCFSGTCTEKWNFQGPMVQMQLDDGMVGINQRWVKVGSTNVAISTAYSSDGAAHPIWQNYSTDLTGIYYNGFNGVSGPGQPILLDRRGAGFNSNQTTWNDTNGNTIQSNYFVFPPVGTHHGFAGEVDTLGRSVGFAVADSSGTTGCATSPLTVNTTQVYGFPGLNGTTRLVKLCYVTVHLKSNFQAHNMGTDQTTHTIVEYTGSVSSVIQSIIVYNGSNWSTSPEWTFEYGDPNPANDNYGDLTKITLPTGGTVSYTWGNRGKCQFGQPLTTASRKVLSRSVDAMDGNGPQTWTFGSTSSDPAGNQTVHTFTSLGNTCSLYETQTDVYQGTVGSTNLLKTITTDYDWDNMNPADPSADPTAPVVNHVRKKRVTTKLPISGTGNFLVTKVETDYDPVYGTLNEKREYDFGTNVPGALLRKATYTYKANTTPSYLTANILDAATQIVTSDASGNPVSQVKYFYDGSTLQSSGVTIHHQSLANPGVRGNLTSVQNWLNTTGTWITTQQTLFYDTGKKYLAKDALLNQSQFSYDPTYAGGYLTQTQSPDTGVVHHIVSATYDFNTGVVTSYTDQNTNLSSFTYDNLARITTASYPDGGSVALSYIDAPPIQIQKTAAIATGLSKITNKVFDGLGRVSQTQLHDPDCTVGGQLTKADYSYGYDLIGHTSFSTVTTPYCDSPGSLYGLPIRTDSDALGRVVKITQTDGAVVTTSYSQNKTTVTDEALKMKTSVSDSLGRLIQVFEDPNGLNYETDYSYDLLDNLKSVSQKGGASSSSSWRARTFSYDSLSRIVCASNPENSSSACPASATSAYTAGTIGYVYDLVGNLLTKTSPKPNQIGSSTVVASYAYDSLNRLVQKSFNDSLTPSIQYGYDNVALAGCSVIPPPLTTTNPIGQRTSMCDAAGAESWSYDSMGRVLADKRSNVGTSTITKTTSYSYNLDGSVSTLTYPYGLVVSYSYSAAGRPIQALGAPGNFTYAKAVSYAADGSLSAIQNNNGFPYYSAFYYNKRLQPCRISVRHSAAISPTSCGDSANVGDLLDYTYNYPSTTNNGNISAIANNLHSTRSQSFAYDSLNRLAAAQTTSTFSVAPADCWAETYTYDPWGNLYNIAANASTQPGYSGCTQESGLSNTTANNANQLSGNCYDSAGNIILRSDCPQGQFTGAEKYDAENHLVTAVGVNYTYDGDGRRITKSNGTIYWYGVRSDALEQSDLAGNLNDSYIFFQGKRISRYYTPSAHLFFYFADGLGTTRGIVQSQSTTLCYDADYYPFGTDRQNTNSCAQYYRFTGKERDLESGLDNFGARYNSSGLGRFMSPDPIMISKERLIDPQQWNMYSYVRNNPVHYIDPTGKAIELTGTDAERKRQLEALQKAAGKEGGKYLYDNVGKDGKHYVGIYSGGPSGNGPSFEKVNAATNKLNGIIQESSVATIQFIAPGKEVDGVKIGSQDDKMTPGYTGANPGKENTTIWLTSGSLGRLPGQYSSTGDPLTTSLADVLAHELGHLDGMWFHFGFDTDGDAVRMENEARKNQGGTGIRIHHTEGDTIDLTGTKY